MNKSNVTEFEKRTDNVVSWLTMDGETRFPTKTCLVSGSV